MECAICFDTIKNSCMTPCNHVYCYNCLIKWIVKGGLICPICRSFIYEINVSNKILYDFETSYYSNMIINTNNKNKIRKNHLIDFNNNTLSPGITITSNNGYGIKIVKLNSKNRFYKEGFRNNDILLFLNNIPCIHHKYSMEILNYVFFNKKNLQIDYLTKNNRFNILIL